MQIWWILVPLLVLVTAIALTPVLSSMLREERLRRKRRLRRGGDNSFEQSLNQIDPDS